MNYPAYAKYKESGIDWLGAVPQHWSVKRGRYLMHVNPASQKLRSLSDEDEVSFVPMDAVGENGGLRLDEVRPIGEVGSGYVEFDDGDVVVAKITPCFENGKGALATGLKNGAALGTTELHVLRSRGPILKEFLFYHTISTAFRMNGEAEMYGAGGQKRVPPDFCRDYPYAFPALEEQQKIVSFLDVQIAKIDALIAKKLALVEKLKERRAALISQVVTRGLPPDAARAAGLNPHPKLKPSGIDWLGDVPEHWGISKFSRVIKIAEGQVDPEQEPYLSMLLIAPNHVESQTGKLIEEETAADQFAESGKYLCQEGDVIYSKIRPALAKATIAPTQCLCSADMYPMRGNKRLNNSYLLWILLSRQFTAWSVLEADRVAMPKINRESLSELRLPIPPIEEQLNIVSFLSTETGKLDRTLSKVGLAIDQLLEYRAALITATVTGTIDVKGVAA
jgi:type I restriction enzyme, S subunit